MYPGRSLQAGRQEQMKQPAQAERDQDVEQGPSKCHSWVTGGKTSWVCMEYEQGWTTSSMWMREPELNARWSDELMRCRWLSRIKHSVGVGKALDQPVQTGETDKTLGTRRAGEKNKKTTGKKRENQQWVGGGGLDVQISIYPQTTLETRNRIKEMSSVICNVSATERVLTACWCSVFSEEWTKGWSEWI